MSYIDMTKAELKKLELYSETSKYGPYDVYFLKAIYEYKDEHQRSEIVIDRINLPVSTRHMNISVESSYKLKPVTKVDIGFGDMFIDGNITVNVLEEYPQKMTLEEVEKKLGYKVEIVSGK